MDTPIDLEMLIAMTNNSEKPQDYIHQSRDPRIDKLVRGPKTRLLERHRSDDSWIPASKNAL